MPRFACSMPSLRQTFCIAAQSVGADAGVERPGTRLERDCSSAKTGAATGIGRPVVGQVFHLRAQDVGYTPGSAAPGSFVAPPPVTGGERGGYPRGVRRR